MERKRISLQPILEETVRLIRSTFPANTRITLNCDTSTPEVLADATQIEQALLNLATNAMQAAHGGSQTIEIRLDTAVLDASFTDETPALRAMHLTRPERTVRLTVSDAGPGMDKATLARVFEPFFTSKAMGEGTGLGLSVVRGIIHAHEGAIVVASEPAKGTTFTIYLPIAQSQVSASGQGGTDDAPNPARISDGGARLLYIDDDESMVLLVVRLLERRNYVVSGFSDASAAIEKLRGDPSGFDVVVSDYNMPYLSGLDVARAVRDIRADLPVAIVSGFIDERLLAQAKDAGVRELIVKTVDVADFCESVHRLAKGISSGSKPS